MLPDSLAVVVIASEKRKDTTFPLVMKSILDQEPDEIVSVGDFEFPGEFWRHLVCAPLTRTTVDALVKRDVGIVATESENILFLCDDHALTPDFVQVFKKKYEPDQTWDFLAPSRFTVRNGVSIPLNMGKAQHYVGGHGGIYRREVCAMLPWSCAPHHPNWDVLHSQELVNRGCALAYADVDLSIEDIEPGATPWL